MSKHTPGPWKVVPPNRNHPSRAMVVGGPGNSIYDAPLTGETEANARLIAETPELLELLQEMVFHHGARNHEERALELRAKAAIAKAEGES